jgi:hypothetical protein
MISRIAISLALLGCFHLSASASITSSPSVKYRVSTVKQVNGNRIPNDVSIQKVQLDAAAGVSNQAIRAINLELANVVQEFRRSADECHIGAQGHPWGYTSKIENIVLTKKYISFVFARETVCGGNPDFEKDPIVFSTKDGNVISVAALFESTFPGRTMPKVRHHDRRLIKLNAELTAALLHDSRSVINDYEKECEHYLKTISYRAWIESKRMVLVPEFNQVESICQKEYMINLAPPATSGIKYDKKKRIISLTADDSTVILERLAKDEAPELVSMDEYIRILPKELQPYLDRGILLLNTTKRTSGADGCDEQKGGYEMYLHAVDINHRPLRQMGKVLVGSCSDGVGDGPADFSAYEVDEHKLRVYLGGRAATLSQDFTQLNFDD